MSFHRTLSIQFSDTETYTVAGVLTIDYTAATYRLDGATAKPTTDLPAMKVALDEFEAEIASTTDPVTDLTKALPSGDVITYIPATSSIKFASTPTYPIAVAFSLRDTLVAVGLA